MNMLTLLTTQFCYSLHSLLDSCGAGTASQDERDSDKENDARAYNMEKAPRLSNEMR